MNTLTRQIQSSEFLWGNLPAQSSVYSIKHCDHRLCDLSMNGYETTWLKTTWNISLMISYTVTEEKLTVVENMKWKAS